MPEYRRRLPHIHPEGRSLFLTWHLHGSLPATQYPPPSKKLSAGQAFVWIDRYLDRTRKGPLFLRIPEVAQLVADAVIHHDAELEHYKLEAFVIMPNHVHMLIDPLVPLSRAMQSLKGYTAREANKLLERTGQPFWQKESYDHWVRNEAESHRIVHYIENNPVNAGLAHTPEAFPWSSASINWRKNP